jgi:hypothetical protein
LDPKPDFLAAGHTGCDLLCDVTYRIAHIGAVLAERLAPSAVYRAAAEES